MTMLTVLGAAAAATESMPANRSPPAYTGQTGMLLQPSGQVLGVHLVLLEQLQSSLQQALQLGVLGVRDEGVLQGAVDGLVVGDLVLGIGLVEGPARQAVQLHALGVG